jgi:multiple sugar transport system ATP-binding protein
MASIRLSNLCKKFPDGSEAVKGMNLEIKDKEFVVFVGPSGCGKTTTLRMIAGLEDVTDGEIMIDNKVVTNVSPKNRDISMVFQNYALYPHLTVYKNMAFGLTLRKVPKSEIDRRVRETAKMLGVEALLKRKPKQLSGGERQRVAIGRAIMREPKVFLMDEPLSNLDAKLRAQMRTEISKLYQRLQTTFVYVTHDQTEAMTLGTRIVVMKDGIIQQTGTPTDLYSNPANMFVAGFIGSPQMNFLDISVKDGCLCFEDYTFVLDSETMSRISAHETLILGLRPHNIHETPISEYRISATVELVERLGSETYLYLKIADTQYVANVSSDSQTKIGDSIDIWLELSKAHFFEPQGARI